MESTTPADASASCYGGGDIAGAVIGSLIGGLVLAYVLYRLYTHYWRNRKDNNLVHGSEDPENAKQEFAFDNPAFRNEKQKAAAAAVSSSPLDTKWTFNKKAGGSTEQRSAAGGDATAAITRSVSLRGSDFTGLGIEICGGRKEGGIYVRKVAPKGPAASIVRTGDRILSITIDLQHMVPEDAATILSYASPYNVQLELQDGNGTLPRAAAASATASPVQQRPPTEISGQPQVSSTSQQLYAVENETVVAVAAEQNAQTRRQLFVPEQQQQNQQQQQPQSHDEISNYPTLKLEASSNAAPNVVPANIEHISTTSTSTTTTTVHRENEKLQQRAAPTIANIQIHPDVEPIEPEQPPPVVNKRTKHLKTAENQQNVTPSMIVATEEKSIETSASATETNATQQSMPFQRADIRNESGIRRDAAGIPQEIPDQMFAAAMAARGNRKSQSNLIEAVQSAEQNGDSSEAASAGRNVVSVSVADEDRTKSAKRPPRPPARGDSLNSISSSSTVIEATEAAKASVSDDEVVGSDVTTIDVECDVSHKAKAAGNADGVAVEWKDEVGYAEELTLDSDLQRAAGTINIELNANHITVHHSSDTNASNGNSFDTPIPIPNKRQHHIETISSNHHDIHIANGNTEAANGNDIHISSSTAPDIIPSSAAIIPSPKPRSSIISLDSSSLVEQVLAAADGFSMETRATLSRQLSELNDDTHVPMVVAPNSTSTNGRSSSSMYNDMDLGTQEEILNNYQFKAEPVLLSSMSSMSLASSQYLFDARASAERELTNGGATADQTDAAEVGAEGSTSVTDDDSKLRRYGSNIPDDVKVSQSSAVLPNSSAAVFSSDGHGVNSISISSMDISADDLEHHIASTSQPSSIIAIDDEDLEFTVHRSPAPMTMAMAMMGGSGSMNGLNNNGGVKSVAAPSTSTTNNNDVFIIESLSSKKTPQSATQMEEANDVEELINNHMNNNHKSSSFVTEIQLRNGNGNTSATAATAAKPPASPPRAKQQIPLPQQRRSSPPSAAATVDRIPRNSEMRFSQATYEERPPRLSGVAGTKPPAFERGHTQSEIPVLVRRPSIPASPPAAMSMSFSGGSHSQSTSSLASLPRASPSKIPVFSSPSGGGGSSNGNGSTKSGYNSSGSSTNGHSPPVQARTNGNGFLYRSHSSLNASASSTRGNGATGVVTSSAIKFSARNPSGK